MNQPGAGTEDDPDPSSDDRDLEYDEVDFDAAVTGFLQAAAAATQQPINWRTLDAEEAAEAWSDLDGWVDWLRHEFALPPAIVPPAWHRHPELVWELSALHQRWLACYDPTQSASAPLAFMTDFAAARIRLREWVAQSGTRLDVDRPSRQAHWPGEAPLDIAVEVAITDRHRDFVEHVAADVRLREQRGLVGPHGDGRHTS